MQLRKGSRNKVVFVPGQTPVLMNGYRQGFRFQVRYLGKDNGIKDIENSLMWVGKNPDGTPNIDEEPIFIHGTATSLYTPRTRFLKHIANSRYPHKALRKKYNL